MSAGIHGGTAPAEAGSAAADGGTAGGLVAPRPAPDAEPSGAELVPGPEAGRQPADLAPGVDSWEVLADLARRCVACSDLAASRTNVVVGVNPVGADILLIGEAPGATEDKKGLPFVGASGRLLDRLLGEVGLRREDIAVANILKCRPPDNRKPKRAESDRCTPWLNRQVELINPLVVCTLGGTALEWALGRGTRIAAARGLEHEWRGRVLVPTYHPSAALRFGAGSPPELALRDDLQRAADVAERLRQERAAAAGEAAGGAEVRQP